MLYFILLKWLPIIDFIIRIIGGIAIIIVIIKLGKSLSCEWETLEEDTEE